ncbi:MAG: hypothetical protein ACXWLF_11610, partial [Myxococcaceae bacterium]
LGAPGYRPGVVDPEVPRSDEESGEGENSEAGTTRAERVVLAAVNPPSSGGFMAVSMPAAHRH